MVSLPHICYGRGIAWGIQYHLCSTYRGLWGLVVVWLSWLSGRALAAQARGVLGLTPGDCWLFHFPLFSPHNIQFHLFPAFLLVRGWGLGTRLRNLEQTKIRSKHVHKTDPIYLLHIFRFLQPDLRLRAPCDKKSHWEHCNRSRRPTIFHCCHLRLTCFQTDTLSP